MSSTRNSLVGLLLCSIVLLLVSCDKQKHVATVSFARFEEVMLATDENELPAAMARFRDQHPTPLLRIFPDDERYMQFVNEFRNDQVVRDLYQAVHESFADLSWLEASLADALDKAYQLDTCFRYSQFVTYIGNEGYQNRVKVDRNSGSVVVVIDQYVVPQMAKYGYFGDPMYIVNLSDRAYMAVDIVAEIVRQHVATPRQEMTLLDYIVAEGKVQYMLEQLLPHEADSTRMRYTSQQIGWIAQNEANVWSYFAQRKLLFENDYSVIHNFLDDAPKTNAFNNSAPRTTSYIGWHIISKYMENNPKVSVHDMLEDVDAQKILYASAYRP